MFVVVTVLRTRRGDEDALVALHEEWSHTLRHRAVGYRSGWLVQNPNDPQTITCITFYDSEIDYHRLISQPDERDWQARVESLLEQPPMTRYGAPIWTSV